ncbi:M4 family metallopeptidase [Clostridium hydrogeniformans]|uniref:M4 family metallopeptidase n=1 Tax=Clostridium hydrogeniformans TaxID=349933 RepID=UPI00069197EA|nr:M4 family metallopeptidase [Clostridium hydrogeniformans]
MKKSLISIIISTAMIFSLGASLTTTANETNQGYLKSLISVKSKAAKNSDIGTSNLHVYWNANSDSPRFIDGKLNKDKIENKKDVLKYVKDNKDAFGLNLGSFNLIDEIKDEQGNTHYKLQLNVDNIEVMGKMVVIHVNSKGDIYSINADIDPSLSDKNYKGLIKLSKDEAIKKAEASLDVKNNQKNYSYEPSSKIFINKVNDTWRVGYLVEIIFNEPSPANWNVFVDATNGEVLSSQNIIASIQGKGIDLHGNEVNLETTKVGSKFRLDDKTRGTRGSYTTHDARKTNYIPGYMVEDNDNNFNEGGIIASAVSAHSGVAKSHDYFKNNFNRNSWDGNGAGITATVNVGNKYLNAYFDGRSNLGFGEGDGVNAAPFAGCLDIVAHEFTHAVTKSSSGLIYQAQSGALNESFSDVFGILIENNTSDWEMGNDLQLSTSRYILKRSAMDPEKYNQPAHMRDYKNLPITQAGDWGGVHTNSGIPNKAFYNIASKLGFQKSGQIYYKALTSYLTPQSQFMDARNALVRAASDIYGENSQERVVVQNGLAEVGIGQAYSGNPVE